MVGPFETEDTGVHTICTRTAMFIPFELVSVLIVKDYTANWAFQILLTLLEAEGLDIICGPFLEFLQFLSTQPSEAVAHPVA
jgi:hypothetical protein